MSNSKKNLNMGSFAPKNSATSVEQDLLLQSERLIRVGSWQLDIESNELFWSPGVYHIHEVEDNYRPTVKDAINFYSEEAREIIKFAVEAGIALGKGWDLELPFVTAKGTKLWVRAVGQVVYENGKVKKLVGTFQDITRRKKAEIELQVEKERFEMAVSAAKLGIWDWDIERDQSYFNDFWFEMLGYARRDLAMTFDSFMQLLHPDDKDQVLNNFKACIRGKSDEYSADFRLLSASGSWRWVHSIFKVIEFNSKKEALRFICINVDVHQKKILEDNLRKSSQEAQSANKAKGNFLAMMSHEIRTPLNGIIGMADLLLDSDLNAQQKEFADALGSSGKHLLNIVNDVLDFSKIENCSLQIERRSFSMKKLLNDVQLIMDGNFREKEIVYICDCDPTIHDYLISDEHRIKQILLNLLSNASKFTPETGAIILHVQQLEKNTDNLLLRFDVCDTGAGIPEDKHQMIFEAFNQADSSVSRLHGGTGLGLSISKQLAELMGGNVNLHSKLGVGSVFSLTLPFQLSFEDVDNKEISNQIKEIPNKTKILVAEDNLVNQKIIKHMLAKMGVSVTIVDDGQALLDTLKKDSFDLILLDIQMPVLDGEQAFKILKKDPLRPPVIALSAHASVEHKIHFHELGMEGFVPKPIVKDELFQIMTTVLKI